MSGANRIGRLALGAALFLVTGAAAGGAAPSLVTEPARIDFGILEGDTAAPFSFLLRNDGDEELVIEGVNPSCGCTSVYLPDSVLPPGGSVPLTGTFSTRKKEGETTETVALLSNDPQRRRAIVLLRAWVQRALTLSRRTIYFQTVAAGEEKEETVLFRPGRGIDFSIGEVEAPGGRYRHFVTDGGRPGDLVLHIVLLPQETEMVIIDTLKIHTSVPGRELVPLRVMGRVKTPGRRRGLHRE